MSIIEERTGFRDEQDVIAGLSINRGVSAGNLNTTRRIISFNTSRGVCKRDCVIHYRIS